MPLDQSHSPSNQPKLTHLTRDRSSSLPQSNSPPRHNVFNPNVTYPHLRNVSLPYNNLPRYPPTEGSIPLEQAHLKRKNKLPSLPLNRKASLGKSSGIGKEYIPSSSSGLSRNNAAIDIPDARPPLAASLPSSSTPHPSRTLNYSRRKFPTIGQRPPQVEPLKIVKRRAGHALADQPSESTSSPSSSASFPNQIEVLSDLPTTSPPTQVLSAPLGSFRNNPDEYNGQSSAVSVEGAFKPSETSGYVYRPSAVVLTDEYYHYQNTNREPLKRSTSVAGVRKLSGGFIKIFKGGENEK
ncbi:uncharacterized protein MELLADRAFT_113115 [Melampsora larici-populina 98AG31]|uniref:Uncharacterized protein n=1 Tax=Melampsora larici-populina (strain 98AG31 / pathotype 3-4-7) TaxID=747676 RepID=F4S8S8_MELLP|nr:uncharacterized protein MELLADRAFT_113115 [Melampsora larici-populina 98AG31]EGF98948.1 hypothetical protein MELLADRAFT_113115 [Melampsora larici-populina 98AG31]